MLTHLGFDADVAEDGLEALAALRGSRYRLVLLDMHMPRLDGYETARRIRAELNLAAGDLPIIALTANAVKGDRDRCLAAGMNDYITKPFEFSTLKTALQRWLPDTAPAPAATAPAPAYRHLTAGVLDELLNLNPEAGLAAVCSVVGILLEQHAPTLAALDDAFGRLDYDALAAIAHAAKSGYANAGAQRLAGLLGELEHAARGGAADFDYRSQLDAICVEAAAVQDELTRYLAAADPAQALADTAKSSPR
ncbi:two-component sensor protein histidine protein kinase, putative [Ricinus communis]|uniref:Two-component sensor protein histidine protein kinase, putative n=1 Tax=Ricinus communis TaxID=3988 RepID=B9TNV0_RICCO|nr:two-component sensor protein histidine protein kinase, putative [Ricinus communis]